MSTEPPNPSQPFANEKPLRPGPPPTPVEQNEERKKLLRSARLAVGFVGVMTLLGYLVALDMNIARETVLERDIAAMEKDPDPAYRPNPGLVAAARRDIASSRYMAQVYCAIGALFLASLLFMDYYPLQTTAFAFIVYLSTTIVGLLTSPAGLGAGVFLVRMLIMYVLYRGMQSGQSLAALKREMIQE